MENDLSQQNELHAWVGRSRTIEDVITAFPLRALATSLDSDEAPAFFGMAVPPLWHWLYFLPLSRPHETRHDGHAHDGEFMPPIPLPRRVWAGSTFNWNVANPLRVGNQASRISRIDSITEKVGKSGKLLFVKVVHEFLNDSGLCLTNEHSTAFLEAPSVKQAQPGPIAAHSTAAWRRELEPDPVLLFRYSALMFNSHRIHYDQPYAVDEEGYPALLVQGPLIATLLMDLVRRHAPDARVKRVELKAVGPSFAGRRLHLCGQPSGNEIHLWAADDEGNLSMTATVDIEP